MSGSLKEFEEWAKQNPYDRTETMKAWRAALKWALLTGSWKIVAQEIKEELYKTDAQT